MEKLIEAANNDYDDEPEWSNVEGELWDIIYRLEEEGYNLLEGTPLPEGTS